MICKGGLVAVSAYGRVIHCRDLFWVLQVVGSNPAAPTNKPKQNRHFLCAANLRVERKAERNGTKLPESERKVPE